MRRVLFRVDASPRIGAGHLMRCLTLADALVTEGFEVTFVSRSAPSAFVGSHRWLRLPLPLPHEPTDPGWELVPWTEAAQREDAEATRKATSEAPFDWTVVDHYRLDATWERDATGRRLVIDDLANRPHDCELLLDQNAARDPALYDALVPTGCTVLTGAQLALLRPEFAAARPAALARRSGAVARVLVSLGGTDTGSFTEPAVACVRRALPDAAIDVVIGSTAPTRASIEALAGERLTVHVDTRQMATLMTAADLAVGAAGTTSWERCCLGLPTLTLVLAENQRVVAAPLEAARAAVITDLTGLERELAALASDGDAYRAMAQAAAALTDGTGAATLARKIRAFGSGSP